MADQAKIGTDWRDDELDLIVADYFVMLATHLSGQPYVKLRHSQALMAKIGRTHRAVEFKHQNISAVLDELGLPWIPGYKPKRNYQNAIFDAIDRYLTTHPAVLNLAPRTPATEPLAPALFVPKPTLRDAAEPCPERLRRLTRKFDPVERDHRNRALGRAGEEFVINVERWRLGNIGRSELAERVRWVAADDGDGAGYDILSFDQTGRERLVEVKTTNGSARTPFFLTSNERQMAIERPDNWCIYRVHLFVTTPRIFTILPPIEGSVKLAVETWKAYF